MEGIADNAPVTGKLSSVSEVRAAVAAGLEVRGHWDVVCRDKNGNVKWIDTIENLVTNGGEDYLLDVGLSGGTQLTSWFLLLTDGTPTVAETDTAASAAGWSEVTAYDEAARPAWTDAGVSGQSVSNSASPGTFTCDTDSTVVGGAGLISNSTKGGTTGTLYAVGAFTGGDKTLDDNDSLEVTGTFTAGGA